MYENEHIHRPYLFGFGVGSRHRERAAIDSVQMRCRCRDRDRVVGSTAITTIFLEHLTCDCADGQTALGGYQPQYAVSPLPC